MIRLHPECRNASAPFQRKVTHALFPAADLTGLGWHPLGRVHLEQVGQTFAIYMCPDLDTWRPLWHTLQKQNTYLHAGMRVGMVMPRCTRRLPRLSGFQCHAMVSGAAMRWRPVCLFPRGDGLFSPRLEEEVAGVHSDWASLPTWHNAHHGCATSLTTNNESFSLSFSLYLSSRSSPHDTLGLS